MSPQVTLIVTVTLFCLIWWLLFFVEWWWTLPEPDDEFLAEDMGRLPGEDM
jgi:hypothetical protein